MPPITTAVDADLIELLERTSRDLATAARTMKVLRAPLAGSSLAGRVRAVTEYRATTYGPLLAAVEQLATTVRLADADRITQGRAHRCPLLGGAFVWLEPIPAGTLWTLAGQLRGDGRPPIAAPAGAYDVEPVTA